MSTLGTERIVSVHHWNDSLFTFRTTRDPGLRFTNGQFVMIGLEVDRVRQGLAILATQPRGADRSLRQVADYSMPNVSDKVCRIIHSYTDYVNRVVWKKY